MTKRTIIIVSVTLAFCAAARADDCPMWGREPSRNMVSPEKNLPTTFTAPEEKDGKLEMGGAKGIKWVARLGSQTYGNQTVGGGRVFVGTNNDPPHDPKYPGDYGVVLCLDEKTGELLWQLVVPKLAAGKECDYENVGICCAPTVDGDRVYVVTNRCEVLCLDARGLRDGNDGPFKDEAQYVAGPGNPPVEPGAKDADIIWRYDMRDELGVFPHQQTSSSILMVGDRLYITTSNGRDMSPERRHIPSPNAPALICLDKDSGKLLGRETSGISARTFVCNWSSPSLGKVNGKDLLIFGADDGFCYAFDPIPKANEKGEGILQEIWRCDCNPEKFRMKNGKPVPFRPNSAPGPCGILATPVAHGNRVYASIGQQPEQGNGDGCIVCIDATGAGDITKTGKVWSNDKVGRSISTVAVADGLVYFCDFAGFLYCFEANTGKELWKYDGQSPTWSSPLLADGKLFVGNEMGDVFILAAGKEQKLLHKARLPGAVYSSAVAANGVLYIGTAQYLFAIKEEK